MKEVFDISLNKQFHIYSVDTSAFYDNDEMKIHKQLNRLYLIRKSFKEKIRKNTKAIKKKNQNYETIKIKQEENIVTQKLLSKSNKLISHRKELLLELLSKNNRTRILHSERIARKNIISIFESPLSRVLGIKNDELSDELIVVRVYFFDVLHNIVINGFIYNGEKYVYFSSSAGQIRTKKAVFIKESSMIKYGKTLMCGLTVDKINELGGVNTNKYMAYLALSNSATEKWNRFDIDRCIVVDDMETLVESTVDFIDEKTYEIQRKMMSIPITHTDGAGMMLPSVSKKNFMIRSPWIKGLLVSFPFDKFIAQFGGSKVIDIYGKEWDIIADKISIIFTKSQFKMWKYYSSWDEYKRNFKQYQCEAGICNIEEDVIPNARLNYQMLQSLNLTETELKQLSFETVHDIKKIGEDRNTMLKILGVIKENLHKNYFQQALEIYPELLSDTYSREILKTAKRSLVKKAKAAKLSVDAKYTFVIPDMFAFCQFLFLSDKNPQGLLKYGEVFCKLFKDGQELDCLRSPHLYREHPVRLNVVNQEKRKWFITVGIYTSVHDPISKVLMFDNDGDKLLVCADKVLIEAAKREMAGIVPLYYNMAVAGKNLLSQETLYDGLINAYTGGNIGLVSNNITKVWNSDKINLDVIKMLCLESNFCIDYAKTLYKPERPKHIDRIISEYTQSKVPFFFVYAKDKDKDNVASKNDSTVNRLNNYIPHHSLRITAKNLGQFDYTMLKCSPSIIPNDDIVSVYRELDLKNRFIPIEPNESDSTSDNLYQYKEIRRKILEVNSNINYVVDVLVEYLYGRKNSNHKTTLWSSFGDILVRNLRENITNRIGNGFVMCEKCGVRVEMSGKNHRMCEMCWKEKEKERQRNKWHKNKHKYRNNATAF